MITLGQARDYVRAAKTVDDLEVDLDIALKEALRKGSTTATVYTSSQLVADLLADRYRETWEDCVKVQYFTGDLLTSEARIGVTILTSRAFQ